MSTRQSPFAVRALVVLGALLSLCVSDSVGPRLLPLPTASERAAFERQSLDDAEVSPAPSRENTEVVRVAMAAPARKQAGAEQQRPLHVSSHAAARFVTPPAAVRPSVRTTYSPIHAASAAVTRPKGRAPPPSV